METFSTTTPYKLNRRVVDRRYKDYPMYSGSTGMRMNPNYGLYSSETKSLDLNPYYVEEEKQENPLEEQRQSILDSVDFFPTTTYAVLVPRAALLSEEEKSEYRIYPNEIDGVVSYDFEGIFDKLVKVNLTIPEILMIYLKEYKIQIADKYNIVKFYSDMNYVKEKIEMKLHSSHNQSDFSPEVLALLEDFIAAIFENNAEFMEAVRNAEKKNYFNGAFSNLMSFKTTTKKEKKPQTSGYRRIT